MAVTVFDDETQARGAAAALLVGERPAGSTEGVVLSSIDLREVNVHLEPEE